MNVADYSGLCIEWLIYTHEEQLDSLLVLCMYVDWFVHVLFDAFCVH